ncbi:hypothetical protein TKK_0003753 [Trichogramma kaykai]
MEPSEIFNSSVKENEELSELSPTDHKNVQHLRFRDNLVLRIPRCDDMIFSSDPNSQQGSILTLVPTILQIKIVAYMSKDG